MSEQTSKQLERELRFEALDFAVRHKARETTLDDTMKSAEKYLEFLQGKDSKK